LLFVGDDWAEAHHDVEVMDESGRRLAKARLPEGVGLPVALREKPTIWLVCAGQEVRSTSPEWGARRSTATPWSAQTGQIVGISVFTTGRPGRGVALQAPGIGIHTLVSLGL
jgi:hypothetical protein